MNRSNHIQILQREMTRKEFLAYAAFTIASVFGVVGVIKELQSHAATPTASLEAEKGSLGNGTRLVTDSTASGSQAIAFGATISNFVVGSTKPTAANTGVDPSISLTAINNDIVITQAGTVIQNSDIFGFVTIKAANVTIRNCRIRGRANNGNFFQNGLIECSDSTVNNAVIDRCTLNPDYPRYWQNGIDGANFTATRCDVSRTCDGIDPKGSNWAVQGCYIHDLSFFDGSTGSDHASDTRFPGWSHNDGLQLTGGNNGLIKGCSIQAYFATDVGTPQTAINGIVSGTNGNRKFPNRNYSNGITISPTNGFVTNLSIVMNWFEGGEDCIQMPAQNKGYDSGASITVSGNRFGLDQKPGYTGNPTNPHYLIRYGLTGVIIIDPISNVYDTVPSVPSSLTGKPISNTTTV